MPINNLDGYFSRTGEFIMVINKNMMSNGASQLLSRKSGVKLPKTMLSKSEPAMSNEEYREKFIEMAKRDATAGIRYSHDVNGEFNTLMRSYTSVVSPDRQAIIDKAMPAVKEKAKKMAQEDSSLKKFVEILLFGEVSDASMNMQEAGQAIEIAKFKDEFGNVVARLSTRGWSMIPTKAETERSQEMLVVYNDAWNETRFGEEKWQLIKEVEAAKIMRHNNIFQTRANSLNPKHDKLALDQKHILKTTTQSYTNNLWTNVSAD